MILLFLNSVSNAQEKMLVQVKTFNPDLSILANTSISLDGTNFTTTGDDGSIIYEFERSLLPPKKVYLQNSEFEAESWNYSKGILEIIVRIKSFELYTIKVNSRSKQPVQGEKIIVKTSIPTEKVSDVYGKAIFPVPINEIIDKSLIEIKGYNISSVEFTDSFELTVVADPIPVITSRRLPQVDNPSENENSFAQLDSINTLTGFYAFLRGINMSDLNEAQKQEIDAVFQRVTLDLDNYTRFDPLLGRISDSSLVGNDIQILTDQAQKEANFIDESSREIFESLELANEKLKNGGTNLSEEERQQLLADLQRLDELLMLNESKFTRNQSNFRASINQLKNGLMNIKELEQRLSAIESEREADKKVFQERLLIASGIVLGLALFLGLMIYLSRKYNRQKKALSKANEEVKVMNDNLEEIVLSKTRSLRMVNKELDTFLYKSSHDLKRPLTSIIGLANIAKMTMDEQSYELFDKAKETADDMNKLLLKLQMVSHINNPSDFKTISIDDMIEEVLEDFKEVIKEKNIDLKYEYCADMELATFPIIIKIVLKNLFENAFYFSTLKEETKPEVKISISKNKTSFIIKIRDNGEGISNDIRKKVWNMFYVGHEQSKGNGLGLYISNKAAKALNGQLSYTSKEGKYAEFKVQIPIIKYGSRPNLNGSSSTYEIKELKIAEAAV